MARREIRGTTNVERDDIAVEGRRMRGIVESEGNDLMGGDCRRLVGEKEQEEKWITRVCST